jgi:hypothetical protein
LVGNLEEKGLGRPRSSLVVNVKMDLRWNGVEFTGVVLFRMEED